MDTSYVTSANTGGIENVLNTTGFSGSNKGTFYDEKQVTMRTIATYVGAGIAMAGILFTLLSYVGYRKFHVKRPHIIMVNLCLCLFLYYLAYMISNHDRQNPGKDENNLCLFGAIVCHFTILSAWFWILVYWLLVLVMYQRPMGGHISHFFIKASVPSYGIPLIITIVCAVIAYQTNEIGVKEGKYVGPECFVDNLYLHFGALAPFILAFIPMVIIFGIIMHGIICSKEEQTNASNPRRNVKRDFIKLSIITVLLAAVLGSSGFTQHVERETLASTIVFAIMSSILGSALLVLFCLNQKEIRSHWVSVISGKDSSRRQQSLSRNRYESGTDISDYRKGSTLGKNHPSVYIEEYDDQRKSSTYRIVAKQDTDMSTLGLIQIPGTPSPARNESDEKRKEIAKVGRKKSDVSKMKHFSAKRSNAATSPDKDSGFDDITNKDDSEKSRKKRKAYSTSSPTRSPKHKATKRQNTSEDITKIMRNKSPSNDAEKKKPKRANSSHRLSRFTRKSTSTIDEETVQLTEFK